MTFKVLLIEDAEETKELVCHALGHSFDITWSTTLAQAKNALSQNEFHLVLLDVGLPDGNGFQFYSILKNDDHTKEIPVVFLTSHGTVSDRVMGISLGAEDYIVKPFVHAELKARVEMRIKKSKEYSEQSKILKKGELEVNLTEQRIFHLISGAKKNLNFTSLEFKILVFLLTHEEHVFSRDELITKVWGTDTHLSDRSIDTHIYTLRKKLGPLAHYIQSVYGQGYRFSLATEEISKANKKAA